MEIDPQDARALAFVLSTLGVAFALVGMIMLVFQGEEPAAGWALWAGIAVGAALVFSYYQRRGG